MATAISSLESYLETMSKGMDQTGPAIACCSLGILFFNKVQDHEPGLSTVLAPFAGAVLLSSKKHVTSFQRQCPLICTSCCIRHYDDMLPLFYSMHGIHLPSPNLHAPCNTQAQYQEAVTYFQRFFDLARGLSDNAMLDAARFNLGVARGATLMQVGVSTQAWKDHLLGCTHVIRP